MTCEAIVIGSVVGLAVTAAVLSFQVITDRKSLIKEDKRRLTTDTIPA